MGTKGWAKIMHTMIVLVSVLEIADGFIAETNKGIKRCYSTDISSDKVIKILFRLWRLGLGFPVDSVRIVKSNWISTSKI